MSRLRYLAVAALVADLGLGIFSTGMAVAAGTGGTATPATTTVTSSAVTVKWTDGRQALDPAYVDDTTLDPGDPNQPLFKNLQVTVAQTQGITDQGLQISWTGGVPTPGSGAPADYLQIMQCWGSEGAAGPTPQQCQWGTPNSSLPGQMGLNAASRALFSAGSGNPDGSNDPRQFPDGTCSAAYWHRLRGTDPARYVCTTPFWSIKDPGKKDLGWATSFPTDNQPPFSAAQSNEVSYARTAADGTGQYIFTTQSALTAPYLGCGDPAYAKDSCWLVIVPRGEYNLSEVDSSNPAKASTESQDSGYGSNYNYVAGSPLSASAWQDRIQIKLSFSPVGVGCDLGSQQAQVAGSELASSAVASWTPALCAHRADLTYSEIGDPLGRTSAVSGVAGSPALDFVADPVDPAIAGTAKLDYAPVADSSLVFSYLIDKDYTSNPANTDLRANGTLVTNLRLTPLLVAKLLTQSYRDDTPGDGRGAGATVPATNPDSLRDDPEFLALNPEFSYFYPNAAPDGLIVPFGESDAARLVWAWLRSDNKAREFLAGQTVDGSTINAAYKGLNLATDTSLDYFPKNDPSTFRTGDWPDPGYGTLDMRPYANDFADGAVRTVTANAGMKTIWDTTKTPAQATSVGAQVPGTRFEIAITTSQAAALYGLPVASLVPDSTSTDAGAAPTSSAMAAELAGASIPSGVDGVSTTDPGTPVAGGYPLTMRTYAVVNVCAASTDDLTAYAKLLDYAAGDGQTPGSQPGELPLGYAPLSAEDRAQTKAVAASLRSEVQSPQCASHQTSGTAPGTSSTTPPSGSPTDTSTSGSTTSATTGEQQSGSTTPGETPTGTAPGSTGTPPTGGGSTPSSSTTAAAAGDAPPGGITPAAYVSPAGRYALLAALCFALPCLVLGPRLLFVTRHRARS